MEKNLVNEVFNGLRDDFIVDVIKEIRQADETGVFEEASNYRELVKEVCLLTNGSYSTNMLMVMTMVFKEYAYRNLNLK